MSVLKKYNSDTSEWEPIAAGPKGYEATLGGSAGQSLVKESSTDRDASWGVNQFSGYDASPKTSSGAHYTGTVLRFPQSGLRNFAITPDSVALRITGDIEIIARIKPTDWTGLFFQGIASRHENSPASDSYNFHIDTGSNGRLRLQWANGSTGLSATSTTGVPFSNGDAGWVKVELDVDNGSGGYEVKFYTAADDPLEPFVWTQLGTTIVGASTTAINAATRPLSIGNRISSTSIPFIGDIYRVIIKSGIGIGNTTVFDADFTAVAENSVVFTESSSNAASVYLESSRFQFGTPGVQSGISSSNTHSANIDYFHIFFVYKKILIDMIQFSITTGPSANSTVRCALYSADSNFQPTGAPIINTPAIDVKAGTTGVGDYHVQVTPVIVEPGAYIGGINFSAQMALRHSRAGISAVPGNTDSFAYGFVESRTHAEFPSSGALWDSLHGTDAATQMQRFYYRWYEV